jgi:hypothetical protein
MRACDIAPAAEGATDRLAAIDPFSGLGTESWLSAEGRTHEAAGGLRNKLARWPVYLGFGWRRQRMRRRGRFCSTSSTSCGIWAKP